MEARRLSDRELERLAEFDGATSVLDESGDRQKVDQGIAAQKQLLRHAAGFGVGPPGSEARGNAVPWKSADGRIPAALGKASGFSTVPQARR